MLSITQRSKLLSVIPTLLAEYDVKLLRKDRLGNDDYTYPSMRLDVISEGIRIRPSTQAPIRKDYLGENGDAREWLGQHQQAVISVTLLAESEKAGTDQTTPEILDQMLYDLQLEIEIYRLGLYWPNDYMKVVPGSGKVNYLPPFQSTTSNQHWIYSAIFDFKVEYEFSILDESPNIHVIGYDFGIPAEEPEEHIELIDIHPPWYYMDICLRGQYSPIICDIILKGSSPEKSSSFDILLINE